MTVCVLVGISPPISINDLFNQWAKQALRQTSSLPSAEPLPSALFRANLLPCVSGPLPCALAHGKQPVSGSEGV